MKYVASLACYIYRSQLKYNPIKQVDKHPEYCVAVGFYHCLVPAWCCPFPLYPIPSFLAKFPCILLVQFFPQRASDNGECFPLTECSTTRKLTKNNSISSAISGQWLYSCRRSNEETTTILTIYIQVHCSHNWLNNIASSELFRFLRPKPYQVVFILSFYFTKCCTHAFPWVASEEEGSRPIVGPVHRQHEQELVVPWLRERH